jgi:hypothetical protein
MNGSTGTMARLLAVASIGAALGLAIFGKPEPAPVQPMPACVEEDGGPYPCVWDGPNRGNGQGARVIITGDD